MPGFFSSSLSNQLTSWSEHYIDWSRVGELLNSGHHHYSIKELAERGLIIASMGYGTYYGYHYSEDLDASFKPYLYSMAGCFIGFVISHTAVIAPLILKRTQMSAQCFELQTQMFHHLQSLKVIDNDKINLLIEKISTLIASTITLNLSDDKHARASQTWGRRLSLMRHIAEKLKKDVETFSQSESNDAILNQLMTYWSDEPTKIYSSFDDPNLYASNFKELVRRARR